MLFDFEDTIDLDMNYLMQYDYRFANSFLKGVFGEDSYKRKYSMTGSGIYNLLFVENKIYEVKISEAKTMVIPDDKKIIDKTKTNIVNLITQNLNREYAVASGKFITFKSKHNKIIKLEIIKKLKMPT